MIYSLKNVCHITPLPPHNGHFLLCPKRPLWRVSTALSYSDVKLKILLCQLKEIKYERISFLQLSTYCRSNFPKHLDRDGLDSIAI